MCLLFQRETVYLPKAVHYAKICRNLRDPWQIVSIIDQTERTVIIRSKSCVVAKITDCMSLNPISRILIILII